MTCTRHAASRLIALLRAALVLIALGTAASSAPAQRLFVGLEVADLPTFSSDLSGFPRISWQEEFPFEVAGAAATTEGLLYLCHGPFTTQLFTSTLDGPPEYACNISVDISALGYGGGKLYGFSNFSSPMGIYEINPQTGLATLRLSTAGPGFRFFGLDYNTTDGLLYGYTEYGVSGLYSINLETGEMLRLTGSPPDVNGQGRGLAVGNHTVYLTATRGDEGEGYFAYDLAQGAGGQWVVFANAYENQHAAGGATWIPPSPTSDLPPELPGGRPAPAAPILRVAPNPFRDATTIVWDVPGIQTSGELRILDVAGRLVATREVSVVPSEPSGRLSVSWNGRDDAGRAVPPGIYFFRADGSAATARVVRVR